MIKAFSKLNIYLKCVVLSGLFLLLLSLALIPLYFINYMDIPLGFILGGGYGMLCYFLIGILENKRAEYYKWAVLVSILRFVVLAALLFFVALCYYKWDIKIFNIFTVLGGYLICLVVFLILSVIASKRERKTDGSI